MQHGADGRDVAFDLDPGHTNPHGIANGGCTAGQANRALLRGLLDIELNVLNARP
jgi:acyl-coenzyme A thioesterase PaaI-like protein